MVVLFITTVFIPLVGMIVGGISALSENPEKQGVGKGLLVFGIVVQIITFFVGLFLLR